MTNPTTDLEHVLELVEKATPGPWRVSGTSHLCDAKRHVIHAVGDDGEAIAAAVNFLREHGRTLLEAMRDAERYRWIVRNASYGITENQTVVLRMPQLIPPTHTGHLGAAIDAARQQENGDERG